MKSSKIRKRLFYLSLLSAVILTGTGCQKQEKGSQKPAENASQKTIITMLYPLPLDHFETLVEKTLDDVDLQVELSTTATINGDSERRLRNGHGTDLVVTTLPTGDVQNYVMDLSAEEYVNTYQSTALNPIMVHEQTRCLPLPGQYSGYVLNETLTKRLGKKLPSSNQELLALFKAGKKQKLGIGEDGVMFGLVTADTAAVGSYIIGTQIPDFLGIMDGIQWMDEFQKGTAHFTGVWDNSLTMLLSCVEQGYLSSQALALKTSNVIPVRERMEKGTLLLSYGNVRLLDQLNRQSSEYQYKMLPFMSDSGNKPWIISSPDAYIAINRSLDSPEKKSVLNACRQILGLLSTQAGQEAWMADTSANTSYLSGYQIKASSIPSELKDCVENGYVFNLQMPSNVVQYFGQTMISVLNGGMTMKNALSSIDDYYQNGSADIDYNQSVVGSVREDLIYENNNTRTEETAIGNLVADAVQEYTGADIAVVNGGGIRASLYAGDVLGEDLSAVCPYANKIIVVSAEGKVIWEMLENGISQTKREDSIPAGRFLQVAGLSYSYQPMDDDKPAKLLSVTMPDGSALKEGQVYSLAITDYMAGISGYLDNNGDGFTMLNLYSDTVPKASGVKLLRETDASYADAMKAYFYNHREEPVAASLEGRIQTANGGD